MIRGLKKIKQTGFTVVEILIVILVIGILATVVIVAYNGVQSAARDKSVMSDIDELDGLETHCGLNKTICGISNSVAAEAWYSGNGIDSYLQFTPSPGNIIDVVVNSTDYCIRGYNVNSATYKTLATAAIKESTAGICTTLSASLAAQGYITNLVTNPSIETGVTGWIAYTGVASPTWVTTTPWVGTGRLSAVGNNTTIYPRVQTVVPVSVGQQFTISAHVRSDGQVPTKGYLVLKTHLNGVETGTVASSSPTWSPDANGWQLVSITYTIPANVDALAINLGLVLTANFTGTLGVDGVMMTHGSTTYNYADGSSSGWVWNGTANASTSTGLPL